MSTHILTTARQFILSRLFGLMPIKSLEVKTPEPETRHLDAGEDSWMFKCNRPLSAHAHDLSSGMAGLSDMLGKLRQTVTEISAVAPNVTDAPCAAYRPTAIWSDALLFDGEPVMAGHAYNDDNSFLFEDGLQPHFSSAQDMPAAEYGLSAL